MKQHARSVARPDQTLKAKSTSVAETQSKPARLEPAHVTLGPGGRVVIPAPFREALKLKEGDRLVALLEDGEVRLLTGAAAIRRVQTFVRQFVPEGVSLVDELLEDRRREVEREERDG